MNRLFHTAALHNEYFKESKDYGFTHTNISHNWNTLRNNIQDHIKSLNFNYRVQLREKGITYLNKLGRFHSTNNHSIECIDSKNKIDIITSDKFVIAVGCRPTPLSCVGSEYAISSDDLFMLEKSPGDTLVIVSEVF